MAQLIEQGTVVGLNPIIGIKIPKRALHLGLFDYRRRVKVEQVKTALRKECLGKLKQQNKEEKQEKDAALIAALLELPTYQKAQTVATFLPMDGEVDTRPFIQAALADGKQIVVPKVVSRDEMVFLPFDEVTLSKSRFGVWEPTVGDIVYKSEIDLIHVPGLVFNEAGFRIGYGGGYYDRYLQDFTGKTVSTIYDFQRQSFLEETHDIAVQEVICK